MPGGIFLINIFVNIHFILDTYGYLTYNRNTEEVRIPNSEVQDEFSTSIKNMEGWEPIAKAIKASDDLVKAALDGDEKTVAQMVQEAHL